MRTVLTLAFVFPLWVHAQWDVPVRIILDGDSPEKRQVTGLADPISDDAAVSVDAYRRQMVNRATAIGDSLLQADLYPVPFSYTAGMMVTITPSQSNREGAELSLNGLGYRPIVKWGGIPIDSLDLIANIPVRLVFDGERFQLIGSTELNCPQGYSVGNSGYCIADSVQEAATFYNAIRYCADHNARLCTFMEWTHACYSNPEFMTSVLEAEWLDHAGNSNLSTKVVGFGYNGIDAISGSGCEYGGNRVPTNLGRFRCCLTR